MKKKIIKKLGLGRVDAQVSILTALIVTISCTFMYLAGYMATYNDMIFTLTERVESIYNYVEAELVDSTFANINSREDMDMDGYKEMKTLLSNVKNTTGVRYLYTAKKNEEGDLIYVIDGLPDSAEDFRYPGDLIEVEIVEDLNRALKGEAVLPKDIVHTAWGDIFIAYLPIHDAEARIIGAIGIEFAAGHQYQTYRMLRITMPIIIMIACLLCAIFAVFFFRRISNPHFQDLANTDYLTQLKNRNAYELDIRNICAREKAKSVGIIIADINGLKRINDSLGHEKGDLYIKLLAEALRNAKKNDEVLYRIGGDEFLVLSQDTKMGMLNEFIQRAEGIFLELITGVIPGASCSFGKAVCEGNKIIDFEKAYYDADHDMYEKKKEYYKLKGEKKRQE